MLASMYVDCVTSYDTCPLSYLKPIKLPWAVVYPGYMAESLDEFHHLTPKP